MSYWELFTWFNAGVLAVGSVIVFALFLRQLPVLLGRAGSDVQKFTEAPDDPPE